MVIYHVLSHGGADGVPTSVGRLEEGIAQGFVSLLREEGQRARRRRRLPATRGGSPHTLFPLILNMLDFHICFTWRYY